MHDFISQPRFQIPSLRELKQARLLKQLRRRERERFLYKLYLSAEHRRRTGNSNTAHDRDVQQQIIGKDNNEHRAAAYAFYCSIIRDPNATVEEQLTARERIDKLLGLDLG